MMKSVHEKHFGREANGVYEDLKQKISIWSEHLKRN